MRVLYSFNKPGYEGESWAKEIRGSSNSDVTFVPFNHQYYLDPRSYENAARLDGLYRAGDSRLLAMYRDVENLLREQSIDAMIVANCPPYHPDFLRRLDVYKALYSADDPGGTYLINVPYLHAYDHVFFVAPAYSAEMDMRAKMLYAGARNADWLPISVFDFECDPARSADVIRSQRRDIDVIYIGGFWRQKLETLARVKKAFGRKVALFGMFRMKHNVYLNVRFGARAWVKPVSHQERVALYQRAKIGFNLHYDNFGLGNQRLYHLPANGVMQISDCAPYLDRVFEPGKEIVGFTTADELIDQLAHYLAHEDERAEIALRGYERTMRDYRFASVTRRAAQYLREGMARATQRSA